MNSIALNNSWMQRMFSSASSSYVMLNRILTFGQDDRWRQAAVDIIRPSEKDKILDICTGTADLALKITRRFPALEIYALDYSPNMLAVARRRLESLTQHNLIFKEGDCTHMEFGDDYFDYVTISFGFRNLSFSKENLIKALKEIYRVLKRGGKFIILETSQPANILIRRLFHLYAGGVVPRIGRLVSGKREPYTYLGTSIVRFFDRFELARILESCGFKIKKVLSKSFIFGAILLYVVEK